MRRPLHPSSAVELRKWQTGAPTIIDRRSRWPMLLPIVGGMALAGLIDALLPGAHAAEPALPHHASTAVVARAQGDDVAPRRAAAVADAGSNDASDHDASDNDAAREDGAPALQASALKPGAKLRHVRREGNALVAELSGKKARLTRMPALEDHIEKLMQQGQTPYSAVVVMEAGTGRIVAVAEHSTRGNADGLAFRPMAPAASVFKVVTTAALLEEGVPRTQEVCWHGGKTRMTEALLTDNPRRDNICLPFDDVLPHSANVAIAKLASRHLTPDTLALVASRFGFGNAPSLPVDVVPSQAILPADRFGFAEAAAGFGDVKISAMHGAELAGIVANNGLRVAPVLVDTIEGAPVPHGKATRAVDARVARVLREMMQETVTEGTARKAFSQRPRLPFEAGGKTGSLTDYDTGLDYSWFVGFAPVDAPELIVSAVVVNTSRWHIKAPYLAKESLREAMRLHGATKKTEAVAAR